MITFFYQNDDREHEFVEKPPDQPWRSKKVNYEFHYWILESILSSFHSHIRLYKTIKHLTSYIFIVHVLNHKSNHKNFNLYGLVWYKCIPSPRTFNAIAVTQNRILVDPIWNHWIKQTIKHHSMKEKKTIIKSIGTVHISLKCCDWLKHMQ